MKIIYNSILPFKGFKAMNLFGILLVRKEYRDSMYPKDFNHERIHTAQMRELLYIGFYIIYFLEWLLRLVLNPRRAYFSISFEEEAYRFERNHNYLSQRKHFAQWRKDRF